MRHTILLFAATAAALVTPDQGKQQVALMDSDDKVTFRPDNAVQAWWDALPDAAHLLSSLEQRITEELERLRLNDFFALYGDEYHGDREDDHPRPRHPRGRGHRRPDDSDDEDDDEDKHRPHPRPPRRGHGRHGRHDHHGDPTKTIYELIKQSNHTTKLAKLVDEHDEIKQLLQDTEHNHTLFVPTDRAFARIPHHRHRRGGGGGKSDSNANTDDDNDGDDDDKHPHKPPKEFVLALLKYHLLPGLYPLRRIQTHTTLPSELHPAALNATTTTVPSHPSQGNPQRIRAFTLPLIHHTRLNFYTRLLPGRHASNLPAKNGLLHAIDHVLVPPPPQTALVRLLPSHFSTLALALETTGLGRELAGAARRGGGTLFAPTNRAWARLGRPANAFLFSPPGRKYLAALVRYHVVLNETLYSDAYYSAKGQAVEIGNEEEEEAGGGAGGSWHADLASWLDGKPISVDVKSWNGFVSIVLNGHVRVAVRDVVAADGVVQVVERVLIPPHRHGGQGDEEEEAEEMSVEVLKSRLEPYLEDKAEEEEEDGRRGGGDDL